MLFVVAREWRSVSGRSSFTTVSVILEIVAHHLVRLALQYLNGREHTVDEIARRLGFSERSPFIRAFRRWTGTTPAAFLGPARPGDSGA